MATIEIGGLTFHGEQHPSGFFFRRLTDWYTLPQLKAQRAPRPNGHGSFASASVFRDAAVPSFEAICVAGSRAEALSIQQQVTGALARPDLRLVVTDELGSTSREVSVEGVDVTDMRQQRVVRIAVDTYAADPLRYGDESSSVTTLPVSGGGITWPLTWPLTWAAGGSDGRLVISNPGTADTFSAFEVAGGLGGFSITEVGTGREIRVEREIPLGSVARVDQRTGRVSIDGLENDISGAMTRDEWFSIPPGGTSVVQFNPIGSVVNAPTLTHRTRPAYW